MILILKNPKRNPEVARTRCVECGLGEFNQLENLLYLVFILSKYFSKIQIIDNKMNIITNGQPEWKMRWFPKVPYGQWKIGDR